MDGNDTEKTSKLSGCVYWIERLPAALAPPISGVASHERIDTGTRREGQPPAHNDGARSRSFA